MGLLEEINEKLNTIEKKIQALETVKHTPTRIALKDFCSAHDITRPTAYAWNDRGLIELEKVGGRQFVKSDSVTIQNKYQRS